MDFNKVVDLASTVMSAGHVPIVIGHAGIGKSQLAKDIANKKDMELVTLYGSLIKEGELN